MTFLKEINTFLSVGPFFKSWTQKQFTEKVSYYEKIHVLKYSSIFKKFNIYYYWKTATIFGYFFVNTFPRFAKKNYTACP